MLVLQDEERVGIAKPVMCDYVSWQLSMNSRRAPRPINATVPPWLQYTCRACTDVCEKICGEVSCFAVIWT